MYLAKTIPGSERGLKPKPPLIIPVIAAADAVKGLESGDNDTDLAYRFIQNVGGGNVYFSVDDMPCDNLQYHGIIYPRGTYDFSGYRNAIYVYSDTGSSIATLELVRFDNRRSI
jgi:hypothetical protein